MSWCEEGKLGMGEVVFFFFYRFVIGVGRGRFSGRVMFGDGEREVVVRFELGFLVFLFCGYFFFVFIFE